MANFPPRPTWSIRNRILVPHLALIVTMVGVTGLVCGSWASARARRDAIERGRQIGETIRRSRFPLTPAVLRQLKGLGGAEFALIDDEGRVVSSTSEALALGGIPGGPLPPTDLSFDRLWTVGGVDYHLATLVRPSSVDPRPRHLVILLPEPALRAAAREVERGILGLSLLAALLAAALAAWVGRTISRPLSEILRAIRRIGRGDLDLEPGALPRRRDEIGELADGVAQMARWLRALQDERVRTERLQLVRRLSASMAHELRNPLTAARMTVQLFIERNPDHDTEPLRIALAELSRMERQVRRFLQAARPEPPRFERVPSGPILEHALASVRALAEHRGVRLELAVADHVPALRADPDQVGQVLANLLLNALEASADGGRVLLAAGPGPDGRVTLDVEDEGPGVAPAAAGRLFQPFVTTKPEGVGLGLALCAAMVGEHGGSIAYERAGLGTRFRVTLPAAAGAIDDGRGEGGGDGACDGAGRRAEHLLGVPQLPR